MQTAGLFHKRIPIAVKLSKALRLQFAPDDFQRDKFEVFGY
jgi:hypothetical protein